MLYWFCEDIVFIVIKGVIIVIGCFIDGFISSIGDRF